ncbi:MAG TPA: hypothetical protein VFU17_13630 [Candidatus Limnocylindrales bacterium]|nr:hypothetical protein [Candidatus Limnocylindrales bacterium]
MSLTVPLSLESLLRESAIDAELAALASMLVEARVPVIVAGDVDATTRARVLEALLEGLPGEARRIELAGSTEDFAWLPEAESLGWRSDGPTPGREPVAAAEASTSVILAGDLAPDELTATWAGVVRIAVRAVSIGYWLAATVRAGSLEELLTRLRAAPFRLNEDELSRLGLVIVLGERPATSLPRVVAAHYLRPVARDMHGHVQKLGPAVLATWDAREGRFEHFGWGVTPELAIRTGRHAGDFEIELDRRREAFERSAA